MLLSFKKYTREKADGRRQKGPIAATPNLITQELTNLKT
jgi:hypothetical protein